MHSNVIDQLVFGFKRSSLSWAILPEASVIGHFGSSDMFNSNMGDNFVKRAKDFVARFPGDREILFDPHTSHFLFESWLSHVSKESSRCSVGMGHRHAVHVRGVHLVSAGHLVTGGRPVSRCSHARGCMEAMEAGKGIRRGKHASCVGVISTHGVPP